MKTRLIYALVAAVALTQLTACVGLLAVGAIAGGTSAVTDRRAVGTQASDKQTEFRVSTAIGEKFPKAHINTQVYKGSALLTGEVANAAEGTQAAALARTIPGVTAVVNELAVGAVSEIGARSNDTLITSKVSTAFLQDSLLQSGAFSITTERGIVYLQGTVTQAEGARAAEIARGVRDVRQVVKVFEYLTDEQFRQLKAKQ